MTISIKGTPRKFDPAELEQRQQGFHNMYKNTLQCKELVMAPILHHLFLNVIQKSKEGYVLDEKLPVNIEALKHSVYMIKPEHLQAEDLAIINERVKQEYTAELQAELTQYRELLTQQLLDKAELAEQKKVDDKKAKLLADVLKEVNGVFGEQVLVPE